MLTPATPAALELCDTGRRGVLRIDLAYSSAIGTNHMTNRPIIPQRRTTHLPAIAVDAMQQNGAPENESSTPRREIMKTMLLAAVAALSLGIGSAYAGDGAGPAGGYVYPGYIVPGSIYGGAQVPVQNTPRIAAAQNGQATHIYGTHSQSQGIWLFPPNEVGGGGSN